jgi:hypothetical protein
VSTVLFAASVARVRADEAASLPPRSAATVRYWDYWGGPKSLDRSNEFYTTFKYTHLKGLEPEKGVCRRDPSTIIKIGDLYYVWYTKYSGPQPVRPRNAELVSDTIPMWDWDLASIWYATSEDGVEWDERGIAVPRGPKGAYDDRSVFTPEIMNVGGRYYLYYQCTSGRYVRRQFESIAMARSDSPHGPWAKSASPVLEPTRDGEWVGEEDDRTRVKAPASFDSQVVHDPCLIVRDGKYWLYYKGAPMGYKGPMDRTGVQWGVAIADRPEGPFVRHPLNPVTNSGHEVGVWPYKEGVAALCAWDGPEKNTIQFAPDGVNFEVKAHVQLPPIAPGFYRPDAYTNTKDGKGVTWGLCHIQGYVTPEDYYTYMVRFDCDLHQERDSQWMKYRPHPGEGSYFQKGNRRSADDGPLFHDASPPSQ